MHSCNRVDISECDGVHCDYTTFIQEAKYLSEYKEFKKSEERVDRLFFNSLSGIEIYTKLWNVVQLLLLLSHGQASVERGFSVNKEIATSNLMEHNLIARRGIKNHVQSVGGLKQLLISKELLRSAQNAGHQYLANLESQKAQKEIEKKGVK